MVRPQYLLDTCILIDHLRGIPKATAWLAALQEGEAVISPVTRAEIFAGGTEIERCAAACLIESFACYSINAAIGDRAGEIRRRHGLELPDALQASVAVAYKLKLVTRNTRDFPTTKFPYAVVPYDLGST